MGNNAFLERQRKREQEIFDAGIRIGIQQCWDFLQLTLRDPEIKQQSYKKARKGWRE